MSRRVIEAVIAFAVLGGLLVLGLWRLEPSLIYYPTPPSGLTPAQAGLTFRDVTFSSADGERLRGWWLPREEPDAPLLLFMHGNAGNREDRLHNLEGLWRAGIAVFIFDYRGYGGSSGRPSESGLMLDAEAAFDWLRGETGGRPIHLFGRSLGGAVAARLALRRPAAGLILESTFTSAPAMAGRVLPIPGVGLITRSRFDALDAVRRLTLPLLIIHGTEDELVPFSMGRALYDAAVSPRKRLIPVPGGMHNDTYVVAGEDYYPRLLAFLRGEEE